MDWVFAPDTHVGLEDGAYALYDTKRKDFVQVSGHVLHKTRQPIEDHLSSMSEWFNPADMVPHFLEVAPLVKAYTPPEAKEDPKYMVEMPNDL